MTLRAISKAATLRRAIKATPLRRPLTTLISQPPSCSPTTTTKHPTLSLSIAAAKQIESIRKKERDDNVRLRVGVESGGCHGFQYKISLDSLLNREDDYAFKEDTIQSMVLVDSTSMSLLDGSSIDFATELIGSSFRITQNPNAKGGGCGCGVSWELKDDWQPL